MAKVMLVIGLIGVFCSVVVTIQNHPMYIILVIVNVEGAHYYWRRING